MRALLLLAILPGIAFAQTAPTCVQGKAGIAPTASITFTPATTNTDGTPIATPVTYELLQGNSATTLTVVAKGLTGSPIAVNTGLVDGTTVYWALVTVDGNGASSAQSNVVCKIFPAGVPNSVTITIT